ncbi:unnamed protein product, partial [Tilletia laevis]
QQYCVFASGSSNARLASCWLLPGARCSRFRACVHIRAVVRPVFDLREYPSPPDKTGAWMMRARRSLCRFLSSNERRAAGRRTTWEVPQSLGASQVHIRLYLSARISTVQIPFPAQLPRLPHCQMSSNAPMPA